MSLLAAYDLKLQYGEKLVFNGDSVTVEQKDRLGIVGPNGTGKSTLLKVLVGQVEVETGKVVRAKGLRIGYLAQEWNGDTSVPLLESVLRQAPGRVALESRLAAVEAEFEEADIDTQIELSEELSDLHIELGDVDRFFAPHHARRILVGLGFKDADFDRPLQEFSGGWRMRGALAGLLFQQPEVLLLDEPTNHLDMPSVNWLNRFLNDYRHSIVLICHDREFLNRHITRVAAFEVDGLKVYRGNYDEYLVQREIDLEHLEARVRKDEQRKKELEAFVTRFKAKASKARQAQSKAKMIERLQEQQVDIPKARRAIRIAFKPSPPSGDPVLEVEGLTHAFGDKPLFSDVNLEIRKGDRIAIVGENGAGKTTLLKLITGELDVKKGSIRFSTKTKPSYFAQHHTEVLDPDKSVLEEVWRAKPELGQAEARGMCGAFLFSGEEVDKKIGVLSGGEKTRVAMARILIDPGNLLLLDEPTNHLDTESAERLTDSLLTYDGTVLFVSHNLDFARRLSNKVWIVANGRVRPYPGSLADYLDALSNEQAERDREVTGDATPVADKTPKKSAASTPTPTANTAATKVDRQRDREEKKARQRERSQLERKVATLEKGIEEAEERKAKLETEMADPAVYADTPRFEKLVKEHAQLLKRLERDVAAWEADSASLEALPTD